MKKFSCIYVCVICAYSCGYTHANVCTCMCMLVKGRHSCYVSYLILLLLFFEIGFSLYLEPISVERLASHWVLGIQLSSLTILETDKARNAYFSSGCWGYKPMSSVTHSKHITTEPSSQSHWVSSKGNSLIFFRTILIKIQRWCAMNNWAAVLVLKATCTCLCMIETAVLR